MRGLTKTALLSILILGVAYSSVPSAGDGGVAPAGGAITLDAKAIASRLTLSPDESAWLREKHHVRARVAGFPPFHMWEGGPEGISVDYLRLICEGYGMACDFVTDIPWSHAIDRLQRGDGLDVILTVSRTSERAGRVAFTRDYLTPPLVIFARNDGQTVTDMNGLAGRTVSVEKGFALERLLSEKFPGIHLMEAADSHEALRQVSTAQADAYIGNLTVGVYLINRWGYSNVRVAAPTPFGNHTQAMAVRPDWPQLATLIDRFLGAMTAEENAAVTSKWLSVRYERGADGGHVWVLLAGILALLVAATGGVLVWNRKLRLEVQKRQAAEEGLRAITDRLEMATEAGELGIWELDLADNTFSWDRRTLDIYGAPKELAGKRLDYEFWRSRVHPDDLPLVEGKLQSAIVMPGRHEHMFRIVLSDGDIRYVHMVAHADRDAGGTAIRMVGITRDISEQWEVENMLREARSTVEAAYVAKTEQLKLMATAIEQTGDMVLLTDSHGLIRYVNPAFSKLTGYPDEAILGKNPGIISSGVHSPMFFAEMWKTLLQGKTWKGHITDKKYDGSLFEADSTISPILDEGGDITNFVAVYRDRTQEHVIEQQLRQTQKLEAIGQLAAGIAHEINTPTQFVSDNVRFLKGVFEDVARLNEARGRVLAESADRLDGERLAELDALAKEIDLEYLNEETPKAIDQSLSGLEQITRIVRAMKEFSHPGGGEDKKMVDIREAIRTTIDVSRNEWKYHAEMETDFDPALPPVPCLPGEFNQVILNLIVNAAHAIADVIGDSREMGRITISAHAEGEWAEIRVSDTGTGIPDSIRQRIFDPFFTTKEVGRGSGQGLAMAYSVITDKHGGSISVESTMGRGSTFIIRLPLVEGALEKK